MRKKKPTDDGPGVADWIVSYGDVMSLLLTFFVLLFSFSTIDAQKWEAIVQSFSGTPSVISIPVANETSIISLDSSSGTNSSVVEEMILKDEEMDLETVIEDGIKELEDSKTNEGEEAFDLLYQQLVELSTVGSNNWNLEIIRAEEAIIIRFDNQILFQSGKAELDSAAKTILLEVMDVVSQYQREIIKASIEGNTDNVPISNSIYRDNFELASSRAMVVVHYIMDNTMFPENKLVSVGYGEYNPVASNQTAEGKAKNRRTDIVLQRDNKLAEEVNE